jgi:hypothetical protein
MSALTLNQVAAMHVRDVAAMPADALLQLKTGKPSFTLAIDGSDA